MFWAQTKSSNPLTWSTFACLTTMYLPSTSNVQTKWSWQNPTSQRLQNPFSRTTNRRPLSHFGRSGDRRRPESRSHWSTSQIASACRWVDRKCPGALCVTCTWSDTHGRGFRASSLCTSETRAPWLGVLESRGALWGDSRISRRSVQQRLRWKRERFVSLGQF